MAKETLLTARLQGPSMPQASDQDTTLDQLSRSQFFAGDRQASRTHPSSIGDCFSGSHSSIHNTRSVLDASPRGMSLHWLL